MEEGREGGREGEREGGRGKREGGKEKEGGRKRRREREAETCSFCGLSVYTVNLDLYLHGNKSLYLCYMKTPLGTHTYTQLVSKTL